MLQIERLLWLLTCLSSWFCVVIIFDLSDKNPPPISVTVDGPKCDGTEFYEIDYTCEKMDDVSLLAPKLQTIVSEMLHEAGKNYAVFETKRGLCRQTQMIERNTSGRLDSKHLVGTAVDFICWDENGKASWDCNWDALANAGKNRGLIWGGDFPTHYDPSHFELPPLQSL